MNTSILLLLALAVFAGCQAPPRRSAGERPLIRRELIMVPIDQARYYRAPADDRGGNVIPAPPGAASTDVSSVLTNPEVSAVQWNRYADPGRPDELMHEAHVVYRREGRPHWRLQPPSAGQQILIGPQLTDGRGEVKPLAVQELDDFMRDGRTNLRRQQEVMARLAEGMKRLGDQQQELAGRLSKLQAQGLSTAPSASGPAANSAKESEAEDEHASPGDAPVGILPDRVSPESRTGSTSNPHS
jgi:hypothetical protein